MVQHMKDDPGGAAPQLRDSTANSNHGSSYGGMGSGNRVEGKIGPALRLDGADDYVNIASEMSLAFTSSNSFTYSAWLKTANTSRRSVIMGDYNYEPAINFELSKDLDGKLRAYLASGAPVKDYRGLNTVTDDTWHFVAMTYDGNGQALKLYVDGIPETPSLARNDVLSGSLNNAATLEIGRHRRALSYYFQGLLDEVRIAGAARSAGWLRTEFNNQSSPTTFVSVGAKEPRP